MDENSEASFSGADFSELLDRLQIMSIRLESSRNKCLMWEPPGEDEQFHPHPFFEPKRYEQIAEQTGLVAIADAGVHFLTNDEELAAFVEASFFVVYGTPTRPNEELVEYFLSQHLSLHVWPYARELVQNTVSRFGWEQYILPPHLVTQNLRPPRREMDETTAGADSD